MESLLDRTLDHCSVQSCRKYCSYKSSNDRVVDGTSSIVYLFTGNLVDPRLREATVVVLLFECSFQACSCTFPPGVASCDPQLRASNDHSTNNGPSKLARFSHSERHS
jgi:hypothetical protein